MLLARLLELLRLVYLEVWYCNNKVICEIVKGNLLTTSEKMYNNICFLLYLSSLSLVSSLKIKTSVNIFKTSEESYSPAEVFDFYEKAFPKFVKDSVPLKELSEKEAEGSDFSNQRSICYQKRLQL